VINRAAYEKLIAEDIALLGEMLPASNLERQHIEAVLRDSVKEYYERTPELETQLAEKTRHLADRQSTIVTLLRDPEVGELNRLRLYVRDTSEDMECLPLCDSNGHEELCPVTNVMQAFRLLRERLAEKTAALQQAETLTERLKQEAQVHAQEARTANTTIAEIYQACSGATGEHGNWHGAAPVIAALQQREEEIAELTRKGGDLCNAYAVALIGMDDLKKQLHVAEEQVKARDVAVLLIETFRWPDPSPLAGQGGPGPLWTAGLSTQYDEDRKKHHAALDEIREALKGEA